MTSSSLRIHNSEHDVFLSFRGEDTRYNFTSHFYQDLVRSNIKVFIDRMLDKGQVLTSALYRAIETAKISLVIFSSGYASSSFCLDELVKILDCKHSKNQIVMPIFYKVDPAHLRKLQGTFEEAFAKHDVVFKGKNTSCAETSQQEIKVSRWKEALEEAANLTGWHVTNTCNEAEVIRRITQHVLTKLNPNDVQNEKSRGQIVVDKRFKEDEMPAEEEPNAVQNAPEGTPAGGGLLVVIIHEAQVVEGKYHTNPYARLLFRGEERKTTQVKKNRDPRWEEEFHFMLEEPPSQDRLHIEVISTSSRIGLLHPKETLGYVNINLADVVSNKRINEKYQLIDSKHGRIQVELQWRVAV